MHEAEDPKYLRQLAQKTGDFLRAFQHLLELSNFVSMTLVAKTPGIPLVVARTMNPERSGPSQHWINARANTSRAAGRILDIAQVAGVKVQMPNGVEVDPFTAWVTVTQPNPQITPDDVINGCELAIGRLESMADRAESQNSPTMDLAATHPVVWSAATLLWRSGHHRQAVEAAYGAVLDHVKQRLGRSSDFDDSAVFAQAFSKNPPDDTAPRLRWPGNAHDKTVKSMNLGIFHVSMGIQQAVRNSAVHCRPELTAQEGGERLAALSLLMSWIDQCELLDAPETSLEA